MGEIPLRVLLFLFGGFAIVSALLKTRARARLQAGGSGVALIELFFGAALFVVAMPAVGSLRMAVGFGAATAGVVVLTTVLHMLKTGELRRAREESEGERLYARVKFGVGEAETTPAEAEPRRKQTLAEAVLGDIDLKDVLSSDETTGEDDSPEGSPR